MYKTPSSAIQNNATLDMVTSQENCLVFVPNIFVTLSTDRVHYGLDAGHVTQAGEGLARVDCGLK